MNAAGAGFRDGNGDMCNEDPGVTHGNLVHNDATFMRSAWARDSAMYIGPVGVFGPGVAGETFRAVAWGSIYSAADIIDVWTIDPTKAILNIQTGF
ncbi:MAG: hypothetical protein EOP05_18540 [Proteobacteria bacterium]|nr:MAG: hypothetical protein EOP05_18540 [Pseudomonadota bacterium]